ncbi:hypothetical protein PC116_g25306 [Phytophthora cactorum]|uniref:Uncharacterized protein n=1 Tax=Phytophthora cactorum TaxID=29920 RepID=A0A8T1JT65_9STRA|nr:hypothetical protein PC114_g23442 [Phytophthora cactorum]KAG2895741.1 hypothetical protein PC117_g23189 [Phytophthora cactorum]KAG2972737.1 hypothetical protein PC119_g23086 [Phytophthora cactorum]KAG3130235.1 hypothetical protein C6341_g23826 [Phytophthora cactorum]KAG4226288.1 hypothetical protein PC116_g25306 [Phytophthora cactorum]
MKNEAATYEPNTRRSSAEAPKDCKGLHAGTTIARRCIKQERGPFVSLAHPLWRHFSFTLLVDTLDSRRLRWALP